MGHRLRSGVLLVLLVALPLVTGAVALSFLAAAAGLGDAVEVTATRAAIFTLVLFLVAAEVAREVWAARPEPAAGPALSRDGHPALWETVDRFALVAGVDAPDRAVLIADVDAAVCDVDGHRELLLGLPLFAGLSRGELEAVIAHELGHLAGGEAAAPRLGYRVTVALETLHRRLPRGPARWILGGYAWITACLSAAANRRHELAADDLSARLCGPASTAAALRRTAVVAAAWDVVQEEYVPLAEVAGRRPCLTTGVLAVLRERETVLAATAQAAAARSHALDPHPPVAERLRRLEGEKDPEAATTGPAATGPGTEAAWTLLTGGAETLAALETDLLREDSPMRHWPAGTWEEVVEQAARVEAARGADALAHAAAAAGLATPVTLRAVLERALSHVVTSLVGNLVSPSLQGQARRDALTEVARDVLKGAMATTLVRSERARFRLSWMDGAELVTLDPQGGDLERLSLDDLVESLLRDRRSATRVRARLLELGADLDLPLAAPGDGSDHPATQVIGVATPVTVELVAAGAADDTAIPEERYDLLVTTTGTALVPIREATSAPAGGRSEGRARARVEGLAAGCEIDPGSLVDAEPGAIWVPQQSVVSGSVRCSRLRFEVSATLEDGRHLRVRSTPGTDMQDTSPLVAMLDVHPGRLTLL